MSIWFILALTFAVYLIFKALTATDHTDRSHD